MNKHLSDFEIDQAYNLVFKTVLRLIQHGAPGKQYEIWLREGTTSGTFGLHSVQTGKSIYDEKVKPIELVVHWTPNIHDAGRILRMVAAVVVDYKERNTEDRDAKDPPPPDDPPETDPEPQSPGVG